MAVLAGRCCNAQGEVIGMVGGNLAFEMDKDGGYIFEYTPIAYGYDVA